MAESKEFQAWAKLEAARLSGAPSIESLVEDALKPEHLKVETYENGAWKRVT
jgi:hypothetical protein